MKAALANYEQSNELEKWPQWRVHVTLVTLTHSSSVMVPQAYILVNISIALKEANILVNISIALKEAIN